MRSKVAIVTSCAMAIVDVDGDLIATGLLFDPDTA
jgi:hypothetical protein